MTKKDLTMMQRMRLAEGRDPNGTVTSMSVSDAGVNHSIGHVTEGIQDHKSAKNEPQKPDDPMAFHNRTDPEVTSTLTRAQTVVGTNMADKKPPVWKQGGNSATDQ